MGQVQELSITKNHWAIDNEYSFVELKTNDSVVNAVENVKQQIKFNKNLEDTDIEKTQIFEDETVFVKKEKLNINLNYLRNRYDILNKKVYTKNTKTWKGVIISINGDMFTAKLFDLNEEGTYEIAQFDINTDITDEDKELICRGAIFYWSVGNIIRNGTQTKQSEIRLRRVVGISSEEFDEVVDGVTREYGNITWD